MHSNEGVWTARVPGELLATCPGIYLAGLALAYGLISLVGLGPPSINLLLLAIMGLMALAGWKISHYYYFTRWTDLAVSGLPKEQTPQPWWLRGCMIAPGLTVAIAIAFFMKGEESKKTRTEAYQRYASRADAKTVKEAVDRYHDECFDDAHVRILRKKHFSKTRYFELMDERMEMTFAIHERVRQIIEPPPEPVIPARQDPPDPPKVHPADLINPARKKPPIEPTPAVTPTPTPQVDPPKVEQLPKKPVAPAAKRPETVEEALADLSSGEDRKVDLALLALRSQSIAVVDEQRSRVSKKLLAVLDEGSQSDHEVLGALERWKADETPVELASRLAKTPERDRYALYDTLEKWKDPRTVDALVAMMATDEKARQTLQYFNADSEEPLIVHLKEHPDLKVRLSICALLSKLGGEKSLAALREVYKERPMQKAATESIRTIQRRPKSN